MPPRTQPGLPPPIAGVPPSSTTPAPPPPRTGAEPDWRPQTYTVKRGDTLHAIALEHGLDYRELAAWNAIENPNLIRVGQVLRISPPGEPTAVAGSEPSPGVTTAPLRSAPPVVESRAVPAPATAARTGGTVCADRAQHRDAEGVAQGGEGALHRGACA